MEQLDFGFATPSHDPFFGDQHSSEPSTHHQQRALTDEVYNR